NPMLESVTLDRFMHANTKFARAGSLADENEAGVGPLPQCQSRRFHQGELAFIGPNHPHIHDKWSIRRDPKLGPELCRVPIRVKPGQIHGRADHFDFFRCDTVLSDKLSFNYWSVGNDAGTPISIDDRSFYDLTSLNDA